MSDLCKEKIAEKVWLLEAKKIRLNMERELEGIPSHQFCDRKETLLFGQRFWEMVESCDYDDPINLAVVLESLKKCESNEYVYWLHSNTNDAGMLGAKSSDIIANITNKIQKYDKDILIADAGFIHGVCFEVGEDGPCLRHWGLAV